MNVWKTRKKDKTFIRLGTFAETAYLTFFTLSCVSFWHCSIWKFVTVYYGNDVKEGFWLHLDMFVAKGNETVVSSCANCINQIIEKICIVPEFPEDRVCNIFAICYCKILSFFEMIKKLGKCSNRCLIQYLHSNRYRQNFCNKCMCNFTMSHKDFFMLCFYRWILKNFA